MFPHAPLLQLQADAIPAKVQAALSFLSYCHAVSGPCLVVSQGERRIVSARKLSQLEEGARSAALNLLRNWFNGEIDLGAAPAVELPVASDPELEGEGGPAPSDVSGA